MRAILITVGDELLIGQVVDTNAAWLGEQMSRLGVTLGRSVTVGDDEAAICEVVARACNDADLVVLTGGLGPTRDDITREAVAAAFGVSLRRDPALLEALHERYRRAGRDMPPSNAQQADVPEGFEPLPNAAGSAPGLWRSLDAAEADGAMVAILPGVPREMKMMFMDELVPRLRARGGLREIIHRTLLTAGIGESNLQEHLGDLAAFLGPDLRLASLPGGGTVRLRLSATGEDRAALDARLDRLEAHLREKLGPLLFGTGTDTLEGVLGRLLAERGLTLAVAESCTGGLVLHRLTNVSGSSAYLAGGVVAYANEVKVAVLGVEVEALEQHGAVSESVARQMAEGVRRRLGADVGISTTGIAGPTGGTPDKPVGSIWIGHADAHGADAQHYRFGTDRTTNKARFAIAALDLARRRLLDA